MFSYKLLFTPCLLGSRQPLVSLVKRNNFTPYENKASISWNVLLHKKYPLYRAKPENSSVQSKMMKKTQSEIQIRRVSQPAFKLSINHVLLTNRRPILCLGSVVDWILDKISGWKKRAHLKKPEHIVVLNNPYMLRCLFLKILKHLGDTHASKKLDIYFFFSYKEVRRQICKYYTTIFPEHLWTRICSEETKEP